MVQVLVLYSKFEKQHQVSQRWKKFLEILLHENQSKLQWSGYWNDSRLMNEKLQTHKGSTEGLILIMGSGGTERLALKAASLFMKPVFIICDGRVNSFAAALETYSFLKNSYPMQLAYADDYKETLTNAKSFINAIHTLSIINNARFGITGGVSPWLLTSENHNTFGKFTTSLIQISIDTLIYEYNNADAGLSKRVVENLKDQYCKVLVNETSLYDSARAFLAMQKIIEKHKLDGITVKCFDLLPHKFTACLGMSLSAGMGYIATCEGDLHASFSMLLGTYLSGKELWMANPSSINRENNTVTFAHCTIPEAMLEDKKQSTLTTHMESGMSTAIAGAVQMQEVTIFRSGGNFDNIVAVTGEIIQTQLPDDYLCRTQAVVKLHNSVDHWIEKTTGNHHILIYGNLIHQLRTFCLLSGITFTG